MNFNVRKRKTIPLDSLYYRQLLMCTLQQQWGRNMLADCHGKGNLMRALEIGRKTTLQDAAEYLADLPVDIEAVEQP